VPVRRLEEPSQLPALGTLRAGLAVVAVGWLLMVAAFGLCYLVHEGIEAYRRDYVSIPYLRFAWRGLLITLIFSGAGLVVMGGFLCLAAPGGASKAWAIANIACLLLAIGGYEMGYVADAMNREHSSPPRRLMEERNLAPPPRGPETPPPWERWHLHAFGYIAGGALVLADIFFCLMLFSVARHLRRPALGWVALAYLGVAVVFQIARLVLLAKNPDSGEVGLGWLLTRPDLWVLYAIGAALTVWWVVLVFLVRRGVTRGMRRAA
jgi:hypothetical protein